MAKERGLGRGLNALLRPREKEDELNFLSPKELCAGQYQPRVQMDEIALLSLAESIKKQGVMQPILVRPIENAPFDSPRYEIIAGERRWRAAQLANLEEIPVLIRTIDNETALAMALIENIQREDLNPLEEARGLKRLAEEFQLSHQEIATAIGRSRANVGNVMRLLNLCESVQQLLLEGKLDMGHARAILTLPPATQIALAQKIVQKGLSVREVESEVARLEKGGEKKRPAPNLDLIRLEEELAEHLSAKVMIRSSQKGTGRLTIHFTDHAQLEHLLKKLRT